MTFDGIAAFAAWLSDRLHVTVDLAPDAARVQSVQVKKDRADETANEGFLNSFIANDLDRVTHEIGRGRAGAALAAYLTDADRIDTGRRQDVRDHPEQVLAEVRPERIPLGRWPSASDHSLVLSQQFAVNRMLADAAAGATLAAEAEPGLRRQTTESFREAERMAESERDHREHLRAHMAVRPGPPRRMFPAGRANRSWYEAYERLSAAVERAGRTVSAARDRHRQAADTLAAAERMVEAAQARRRTVDGLESAVRSARHRWGDAVPDPADFAADAGRAAVERREQSAPWADRAFAEARTRLFLEALRLHRAFLSAAGDVMTRSLRAAMEIVGGDAPKDLAPEVVRAAWQNIFLTVPVVSATFASYDRLFAGLGCGDLGWLFVDEAGQASPQMPVGALWRTRRAVLVGDPLQLEPVVVLPWAAQQRLREHRDVAQEWAPSWTSAQQVADRLGRWGTTLPAQLPDGSTQVWVGSPLRVHRRCDNPMFAVSNAIAYAGLVVHGVGDRGEFRPPRESFWWHVRSAQAEGKWIPAEGRALVTTVRRLLDDGLPADQLYVISLSATSRRVRRNSYKAWCRGTGWAPFTRHRARRPTW